MPFIAEGNEWHLLCSKDIIYSENILENIPVNKTFYKGWLSTFIYDLFSSKNWQGSFHYHHTAVIFFLMNTGT